MAEVVITANRDVVCSDIYQENKAGIIDYIMEIPLNIGASLFVCLAAPIIVFFDVLKAREKIRKMEADLKRL